VMDGLTATHALRRERALQALPVIALTAGVMPEQREKARAAGCNDFLAKPVDLEELVAVLLRWTATPIGLEVASADESLSGTFPEIPGLDTDYAMSLLGDDRDFFLDLLQSFVTEFATAVEATRTDLERDDGESARRRLHALKSAAQYIGALDLGEAAQRLETAIHLRQPELEKLVSTFEVKLADLVDASTSWLK